MTWWSNAGRRIGSADAVSWPVFWITLGAGIIGNVVTNADAPLEVRALALGAGQFSLWVPLSLVGLVLRREPHCSRAGLVLAGAVSGLLARALVIGAVTAALLGQDEVRWSDRFVGALFNVGLAFVVSAYIVSSVRERRRQIASLQAVQRDLVVLVDEMRSKFAQRNEDAVAQVQAILMEQVRSLDIGDAQGSLDELQRMATEIVRPLSHELAKSRPGEGPSSTQVSERRVSWLRVLDSAATGAPFRPGVTALLMGAELVAATTAYPPGVLVFILLGPAMWVLVTVANAVLRRFLPGRRRGVRITAIVVSALAVGVGLAVIVRVPLLTAPMVDGLTLGAFFFAVVFTLGVGIAASFARDRAQLVRDLQESSQTLQRRLVQWYQAQWFQQKALSRALHGPIQTAVTTGVLHLDAAIRAGRSDASTVAQVREQLLRTLDALGTLDATVASVDEALDLIASTWEGLCRVSTSVEDRVESVLEQNTALRSCVIDIVTEAISNAVRHGHATRVSVAIDCAGDDQHDLFLRIDSDSRRGDAPGGRGLGTQLLEECTLDWRLKDVPGGLSLVAQLPADAL